MAVFSRQDLFGERQVYRTTGSLVAWWAWVAFAVVLLVVLALGHHDHAALVTVLVVIAITGVMYSCALRPRIVAEAGGITVCNPLRVHVVPWPAVTRVDLRHNVSIHYPGPAGEKIVHSWAVQSSSRSRTRNELRARREARRGTAPQPGYGRLPETAQAALAGPTAEFIARQLDEQAQVRRSAAASAVSAASAGTVPGPGPAPAAAPDPGAIQVRWSWGPIAVMVVPLLVLMAVTLV